MGVLMALWLGGCALVPEAQEPRAVDPGETAAVEPERVAAPDYWWYVRFRMHWPEDSEPPWFPDLWIADAVLAPLLEAEADAIALWRVHRRAARDGAGRQFSFIFRSTPEAAARINDRIRADATVAWMQGEGLVERVLFDDPGNPQRPGIGDTSDRSWSPQMQEAWPHFIEGVSRLWLELIREFARGGDWPRDPATRYAALSDRMDREWQAEGGHALLHHLNAIFGYREVQILRRELLRF